MSSFLPFSKRWQGRRRRQEAQAHGFQTPRFEDVCCYDVPTIIGDLKEALKAR